MIFYHGTSLENWKLIKKEGVLWGGGTFHKTQGKKGYRYTYLTPDIKVAKQYGEVILEVDYKVTGKTGIDNFGFDPPAEETCWQFSVFVSILTESIKKLTIKY